MVRERTPLRERVYNYLKTELGKGTLEPGKYIDMELLSSQLKISRTPLRDVLIRLEVDGIVTIYPRRGVMVNPVTLTTVRDIYQICGALESALLFEVFDYIAPAHLRMMRQIVDDADEVFAAGNFEQAHELNSAFHSVFRGLSGNDFLKRQLDMFYQRLYYFPKRKFDSSVVKEGELAYWRDHRTLTELIEAGKRYEAANFLRDVHWQIKEDYANQFHVLGGGSASEH